MKNKKGFTLVELLAVIAILAILVIMALPAVLRMFNQARIDTFSNEVNTILRTAKQQYLLDGGNAQTWTNADGSTKKLPLTGNSKLKYYVKMNGNGQITKLQVTNGEYQYSKSGIIEDVVKNDIKVVSDLSEDDKLVIDGSGLNPGEEKIICRRATSLHTSICKATDNRYSCRGAGFEDNATITYGSLGTNGTLSVGDAFDCDVNGDGTYDSNTERFYYVSPKDADTSSEYVTLIYYNNVTNGISNSEDAYSYGDVSWEGPNVGYLQLPTTSQWSNVSLTESTRQIKTSNGGNVVIYDESSYNLSTFTYENRAARFLTYQEIANGCSGNITRVNGLSACLFLLENTWFTNSKNNSPYIDGFWLENYVSTVYYVNNVSGLYNTISSNTYSVNNSSGIRPAIEVNKKNIEY